MRKTFRTHIILLVGRLLCILEMSPPIIFTYALFTTDGWASSSIIMIVIFNIAYSSLLIVHFRFLWPLCWGKLIITQKAIIWRCLFYKRVIINYENILYTDLRIFSEGNIYKNHDYYKTGFKYLLISSQPLPNARIDKIQCNSQLIKFPYNNKLGNTLYSVIPTPHNFKFKPKPIKTKVIRK